MHSLLCSVYVCVGERENCGGHRLLVILFSAARAFSFRNELEDAVHDRVCVCVCKGALGYFVVGF